MTDANGTRLLSKSQAWSYAEKYLETRGLTNIRPDEVKVYQPDVYLDTVKKQRSLWIFEINRTDPAGFERGGIIAIDVYDGQVVGYASFC